jgi:hypothetical protein
MNDLMLLASLIAFLASPFMAYLGVKVAIAEIKKDVQYLGNELHEMKSDLKNKEIL